jgi:hypothetical protein
MIPSIIRRRSRRQLHCLWGIWWHQMQKGCFIPWVTLIITTLFKLNVVAGFRLLNAMIRCKKIWLQQWEGEKGGVRILIMICNCERT